MQAQGTTNPHRCSPSGHIVLLAPKLAKRCDLLRGVLTGTVGQDEPPVCKRQSKGSPTGPDFFCQEGKVA